MVRNKIDTSPTILLDIHLPSLISLTLDRDYAIVKVKSMEYFPAVNVDFRAVVGNIAFEFRSSEDMMAMLRQLPDTLTTTGDSHAVEDDSIDPMQDVDEMENDMDVDKEEKREDDEDEDQERVMKRRETSGTTDPSTTREASSDLSAVSSRYNPPSQRNTPSSPTTQTHPRNSNPPTLAKRSPEKRKRSRKSAPEHITSKQPAREPTPYGSPPPLPTLHPRTAKRTTTKPLQTTPSPTKSDPGSASTVDSTSSEDDDDEYRPTQKRQQTSSIRPAPSTRKTPASVTKQYQSQRKRSRRQSAPSRLARMTTANTEEISDDTDQKTTRTFSKKVEGNRLSLTVSKAAEVEDEDENEGSGAEDGSEGDDEMAVEKEVVPGSRREVNPLTVVSDTRRREEGNTPNRDPSSARQRTQPAAATTTPAATSTTSFPPRTNTTSQSQEITETISTRNTTKSQSQELKEPKRIHVSCREDDGGIGGEQSYVFEDVSQKSCVEKKDLVLHKRGGEVEKMDYSPEESPSPSNGRRASQSLSMMPRVVEADRLLTQPRKKSTQESIVPDKADWKAPSYSFVFHSLDHRRDRTPVIATTKKVPSCGVNPTQFDKDTTVNKFQATLLSRGIRLSPQEVMAQQLPQNNDLNDTQSSSDLSSDSSSDSSDSEEENKISRLPAHQRQLYNALRQISEVRPPVDD